MLGEVNKYFQKKNYYGAFYALAMAINDECLALMERNGKDFVKACSPDEQDSFQVKSGDDWEDGSILAFKKDGGKVMFLVTDDEYINDGIISLDREGFIKDGNIGHLVEQGYAWWVEIGDGLSYNISDTGHVYSELELALKNSK